VAETCQANIGLYLGGAVPVAESLARAFGCGDPATVTLRGGCVHGHVKEKRYCARHGVLDPDDAAWFCLDCAQAGHDCPVTVELVVTP
jgi:hypothetical protein